MTETETGRGGRPANILYCIDQLGHGGTELQLIGLLKHLDPQRLRPFLCTTRPSTYDLTALDLPTLRLDVRRILSLRTPGELRRLSAWMQENRIDIVQSFFQDPTVIAITAAAMARVGVRIAGFRDLGFWHTPRIDFMMRRVYPYCSGFIANSQTVKTHYVQHDGLDPDDIEVIYNGIDSRQAMSIAHEGPATDIGLVGNLNRRVKRTDLFIRAAARLSREYPDTRWHIIGDGNLKSEYQTLATELGVDGKIIFAGRIEDMASYLDKIQIGVLCSDSEGFSNALLEYMFKGAAVVATDVGGNAELVDDGRSGLLVPPDNARALAGAIGRLISDASLRRRLADAARAEVEQTFSWAVCARAHEAYYERLLQRRTGPEKG